MADNTGLNPLVIDDFSGGMTDFILGGAVNTYELAENAYINENNDLFTRPGSKHKINERTFASGTIRNIIDNQDNILLQAGKILRAIVGSSSLEIKSPQTHDVFTRGDDSSKCCFTYWNKHTLGVTDAYAMPQKMYKNAAGTWVCTQLGLPEFRFSMALSLANNIKLKYNAHVNDLTEHPSVHTAALVTTADATDFETLFALVADLSLKYELHQADATGASTYHDLLATTSYALSSSTTPQNIFEVFARLLELKTQFNLHDGDTTPHLASGTQQVTHVTDVTITGAAGTRSYIYGFQLEYRYAVGTSEYLERGPVHLVEVTNINEPSVSTVTVTNVPVLASGVYNNWDDSNIKIVVYRSAAGGGTLYLNQRVSNGSTTITDKMSDITLQKNETSPEEGGVLPDEAPLPAKFIRTVNDVTCYAGVKEGTIVRGNRVMFSKRGKPYSVPSTFFETFEDDVTGVGAAATAHLIFLDDRAYRLDGGYDEFGIGSYTRRLIKDADGTVSHDSIVVTQDFTYYAGRDGFYKTDGFMAMKISGDIPKTYKGLYNKSKIKGAYDATKKLVIWSVQGDESSTENEVLFVAHLSFETKSGGHPFTTWAGGMDAANFTCTSVAVIDSVFYRADKNGYLLYHDDSFTTDLTINTSVLPANWATQTIFYDIRSIAFDFGDAQVRKWVSKININANNESSLSLQISSANDKSDVYVNLAPITRSLAPIWGVESTIVWGETELRWGFAPAISEWRFMNAIQQSLRCMYKQVRLTNAYTEIDNSNSTGAASINSVTKQATLLSFPTNSWLTDPVNYFISFSTDNYVKEYKITAVAGGVLTLSDGENTLVTSASASWKIKGYKKNEVLNLLNYVLSYKVIGMSQETYKATT